MKKHIVPSRLLGLVRPALTVLFVLLASGCVGVEDPTGEDAPAERRSTGPVAIVDIDSRGQLAVEGAGGAEIPRVEDARILPGVARLVGTFSMTGGTGFQFGYSTNAGRDFTWLDPFLAGTTEFEVPVDVWEENGERWVFYHEAVAATPDAPGAIVDGWSLQLVTALE